ncbi:MAG TPA: arylsulfotransferase family protein [Humibacter sp.]|nr:arylsulfotransferase family protein [Humibacter sp.]
MTEDIPSQQSESRVDKKEPPRVVVRRRSLILGGGLAGLGLLGGGAAIGRALKKAGPGSPSTGAGSSGASTPATREFVSTDVTAPAVSSWRRGPVTPGLVFVTQQVKGFNGLIMEESGEPVWIEPTKANLTDLRVQTLEGKPVLTYWSGTSTGGHGAGKGTILDATYSPIATVRAGNGLDADLHEFNLTSAGTALLTAYSTVKADLSPIGGAADGYIYNCHVQEVDVRTGKVLLDWSALDHVGIDETYLGLQQDEGHDGTSAGRAFDAYHLNAVDDDDDRLLVSLRHTHTVYAIDRASGEVLWRFGGKKSDFTVAPDAVFAWQHDVRRQPGGTITLFDNHLYSGTDGESRGMVFTLDEKAKAATLSKQYTYDRHLGTAMGSTQVLDNGNVLIGWGTDPAVTEFNEQGHPVYEATLGGISYRAARSEWTAKPSARPSIAAEREGSNVRVYLSWNGATEVSRWRIHAGESESSLRHAATAPRSGFETSTRIAPAKIVSAQAVDASGKVIGTTATISV